MKNLCFAFLFLSVSVASAFLFASCKAETTPPPAPADSSENDSNATVTKVDHVDAAGAAALLASDKKPVVLDIRTPEEFGAGHIKGAKMIDFKAPDFEAKVAELDRDQSYLIHCRSGGRSTSSLPVFKKLHFKHIIHLDGGFSGWQEAGNAVAK